MNKKRTFYIFLIYCQGTFLAPRHMCDCTLQATWGAEMMYLRYRLTHSPVVQCSRPMGRLPANQASQHHALLVGPTIAYWLGPKGRRLPSGIQCWSKSLWMVAAHPVEVQNSKLAFSSTWHFLYWKAYCAWGLFDMVPRPYFAWSSDPWFEFCLRQCNIYTVGHMCKSDICTIWHLQLPNISTVGDGNIQHTHCLKNVMA